MNSNKYCLLIIVLFQCLVMLCEARKAPLIRYPKPNRAANSHNCTVRVPLPRDIATPMPFAKNISVIRGYLHIKPGNYVTMTCPNDKFVSIADENTYKVEVKCLKGDFLEYQGLKYNYHEIKCYTIPEPEAELDLDTWKKYSNESYKIDKGPDDCYIPMSSADYKMPVPFSISFRPSIMTPDSLGNIFMKHNTTFKLTCTTARFQMLSLRNQEELTVRCAKLNYILYNGTIYKFSDFRCINVPRARLLVSSFKCQQRKHSMVAVGFQSKHTFLILYNACFDTTFKSNVYSWYKMDVPYRNARQHSPERPVFIKTKQMFGGSDVNTVYKSQVTTISKILKSKTLTRKYVNMYGTHFLSRGHLVAKTDFYYAFEQEATFFYENTAPQWQFFNREVWRVVEKYFRKRLALEKIARHLIVTGTFGVCTLPDINSVQQPLYLELNPPAITVPKYVWKMDYNLDFNNGLVIIGRNDPYSNPNESWNICNTMPCPPALTDSLKKFAPYVHCCTVRSFERYYGKLDPLKWRKNLL